jgi:5-oxoprolinase (ATP-hydrolysing) subunit C
MSGLYVNAPGVLTLLQDLGRTGVAHLGLSVGGPVDLHAFCWANYLLGNPCHSPTLEITMGQFSVVAQSDMMLALTGADCGAAIDDNPIRAWHSFPLLQGQTLKLGYARSGLRGYLAVRGGFNAPNVFGSAATVMRNHLGGLAHRQGSAIQRGDVLPVFSEVANQIGPQRWVPSRFIPEYNLDIEIDVIESYQHAHFSQQQKERFYSNVYVVTDKFDRMGIRLQGEPILCQMEGIISEGIALGAIQCPPNGQPIILMNDRQTLGGYPKIGCVSKMGLIRLAQARAGSQIRFKPTTIEQQRSRLWAMMRFFNL